MEYARHAFPSDVSCRVIDDRSTASGSCMRWVPHSTVRSVVPIVSNVVHLASRFELLEQLSQHQEEAYERLYKWVQERCQTLEDETPAADVTLQVRDSANRMPYRHAVVLDR